jgi:hypothetical protein
MQSTRGQGGRVYSPALQINLFKLQLKSKKRPAGNFKLFGARFDRSEIVQYQNMKFSNILKLLVLHLF